MTERQMKITNYFGLMGISWGLGLYDSKAYVYISNPILEKLCHWYLRLRGFKQKEEAMIMAKEEKSKSKEEL